MIAPSGGFFSTAASSRNSSTSSCRRSAQRETAFGKRSTVPALNRSAPVLKPVVCNALIAESVRRRVAGEPVKVAAKSDRSPSPTVRRLRAPLFRHKHNWISNSSKELVALKNEKVGDAVAPSGAPASAPPRATRSMTPDEIMEAATIPFQCGERLFDAAMLSGNVKGWGCLNG